jgi:hypothetical protein
MQRTKVNRQFDSFLKFNEQDGCLIFTVRVVPRSSRNEIIGEHDGALKIKLAAPPIDGAANAELIKLLAKAFGVANRSVEILSGQTSKTKQVKIKGATKEKLIELINVREKLLDPQK